MRRKEKESGGGGKKVEGVNEGGTRGLDKVPQTRKGERPRALSAQSPRLLRKDLASFNQAGAPERGGRKKLLALPSLKDFSAAVH